VESLSKQDKLELLVNTSPEILQLMSSFKETLIELKEDNFLQSFFEKSTSFTPKGKQYMITKFQLMMSYCINIAFYLLKKSEGDPMKDHPVFEKILKIRELLQKLKGLDSKIEEQLDKILQDENIDVGDSEDKEMDQDVIEVNPEQDSDLDEDDLSDINEYNQLAKDLKKKGPTGLKRPLPIEDDRPLKKQKLDNNNNNSEGIDPNLIDEMMAEEGGEDDYYKEILNRKKNERKLKRVKASGITEQEMIYTDKDVADGKRPIDDRVKNKTLPKRRAKKSTKNPRVKNKLKWERMKVRRQGQVPKMKEYSKQGIQTGINPKVVGSTRLG